MNVELMSFPTLLVVAGIVLIILEMAVFGFSTLFLLFLACGCFITALLLSLGMIPGEWLSVMLSVALTTAVSAVALWKPLRRLQGQQQSRDSQPNLITGLEFTLPAPLAPGEAIEYAYSGITWKVYSQDAEAGALPVGTPVRVVKASVGKLFVVPCASA